MLVSRIAKCPKHAVVVSPLAAVIEVVIDKKKVRRMKPPQLKEALRWEAEPYMTVLAAESLVGYELGPDTGEGQMGIWVSTLAQEDYRSLKEAFAAGGLKLQKAYPPDACFPVAAMRAGKGEDQVVIDVGRQMMRAALIEDGRITAIQTVPASLAAVRAHLDGLPAPGLEPLLKKAFEAWRIAGREFVLTGPGGSDDPVVGFFREVLGLNAAALELQAGGAVSPEYASVTGAGLRQLRVFGGWKSVGVDDGVALGLLIRQRVQILPVVTVLTLLAFFLGHYFHLINQLDRHKTEVEALTAQKEEYAQLQGQAAEVEAQLSGLRQKVEFIEERALDAEKLLLLLLSVVVDTGRPGGFSIVRVQYLPGDQVLLEGEAPSPAAVTLLTLALQEENWCRHATIESIVREQKTESVVDTMVNSLGEPEEVTREVKTAVYKFRLKVSLDRSVELRVP
jgi:Tfp pilus assembly protein PilN